MARAPYTYLPCARFRSPLHSCRTLNSPNPRSSQTLTKPTQNPHKTKRQSLSAVGYIQANVPETKGKSLEQIEEELGRRD